MIHVVGWWIELRATKAAGFAGLEPIDFKDISAWSELSGATPSPSEVVMIRSLDDSVLRSVAVQAPDDG